MTRIFTVRSSSTQKKSDNSELAPELGSKLMLSLSPHRSCDQCGGAAAASETHRDPLPAHPHSPSPLYGPPDLQVRPPTLLWFNSCSNWDHSSITPSSLRFRDYVREEQQHGYEGALYLDSLAFNRFVSALTSKSEFRRFMQSEDSFFAFVKRC